MPRSRATEIALRQSPLGPHNPRTSISDSDPPHIRSPKLADGRSPRGQEELNSLKNQLTSTEAAKEAAQDQLEKKPNKQQKVPEALEIDEKHSTPIETQTLSKKDGTVSYESSDGIQQETDVFEVPIEKVAVEPKAEVELPTEEDELEPKSVLPTESPAMSEPENPLFDELALKNDEIILLNSNLDEKEKELETLNQENESLKNQLDDEKSVRISSAQSEIDDLKLKLNKVTEELEKSKSSIQVNDKLEAAEKAKEELEDEMKKLRVQTEQWKKAADAAASVLAGGVETGSRRISERCGSMDKFYCNTFDHVGGYGGYIGSPGLIYDSDDVFGSEKRKGIRLFGDLWKKKCQK